MAWSKTEPNTGSKMVDTPTIYSGNWDAIDAWLGVQHNGFSSALSGQHKAGEIGVMSAASSATIAAYTGMGSAAIGWATDTGELLTSISGWSTLQANAQESDSVAIQSSAASAVAGGGTVVYWYLGGNSVQYNPLSDFVSAAGVGYFIAPETGKYMMTAMATFSPSASVGDYHIVLYMQHYTSGSTLILNHYSQKYVLKYEGDTLSTTSGTTAVASIMDTNTFSMTATDFVQFLIYNSTKMALSASGVGATYISVKRVE